MGATLLKRQGVTRWQALQTVEECCGTAEANAATRLTNAIFSMDVPRTAFVVEEAWRRRSFVARGDGLAPSQGAQSRGAPAGAIAACLCQKCWLEDRVAQSSCTETTPATWF